MNYSNFLFNLRRAKNTPVHNYDERVLLPGTVDTGASGNSDFIRAAIVETVTLAGASIALTTQLPPGARVKSVQRRNVGAMVLTTAVKLGVGISGTPAAFLLSSKEMAAGSGIATGDTQAIPTAASDVVVVNEVFALPFVDSTGSGNFTITIEGITTGAIVYSATVATLVSHINTALDAAFGTAAIVASGGSLAAVILTCSGNGYTGRSVGLPTATLTTGTQFTAGPATVTTTGSRTTGTTISLYSVDTSGAAAGTGAGVVKVAIVYEYLQPLTA